MSKRIPLKKSLHKFNSSAKQWFSPAISIFFSACFEEHLSLFQRDFKAILSMVWVFSNDLVEGNQLFWSKSR